MQTQAIYGTVYWPDGTPAAEVDLQFELNASSVIDTGVVLQKTITITTGLDGTFAADLWVNTDGDKPTRWEVKFPSGEVRRFSIAASDGPVPLHGLIGAATVYPDNLGALYALLDTRYVPAGGVVDFDALAPLARNGDGDIVLQPATASQDGYLAAADKQKLDGIDPGATVNSTDADLRSRSTHTGTQPLSSIEGLQTTPTGVLYTSPPDPDGDITEYTVPGTYSYTVPAWARRLYIAVIGAGGGGGSGRRGAAGTSRCGGAGGGGGGFSDVYVTTSLLPAATLDVVVPAGAAGAASVTTDDSNGAAGGNAASATVSCAGVQLVTASGGGAGAGGTNAATSAGGTGAPFSLHTAGNGGAGRNAGSAFPGGHTNHFAPAGGGGGGGLDTSNNTYGGGQGGGSARTSGGTITNVGGNAGVSAGQSGQVGTLVAGAALTGSGGSGGGGGSSGRTVPGGNGGNGTRGGGGGGGGASENGQPSGAGGSGGAGYVRIVALP